MAIVGFLHSTIAWWARSAILLYSSTASREPRFSPNSEMSAPDTNALPPAPESTTTRTASSRPNASRILGTACHMSTETALWRAGLLNVIQPTAPSLRAIMRSVPVSMVFSIGVPAAKLAVLHDLAPAQAGNRLVVVAERTQHLVGVLAALGRRIADVARRTGKLDRLVDDLDIAELGVVDAGRHAEVTHLRILEHLVHFVYRAARNAGCVENVDPFPARPRADLFGDRRIEGDAILRSQLVRRELRVAGEMLGSDRAAEALEDVLSGGGDVDEA